MGLIISIDGSGLGFSPQGQGQSNELISEQFYGVEFDTEISNPSVTRIGKIELHRSLPIHSKMRRCILKDSGEVAYYLNSHNSNLKENGEPAVLDGTDGQVMVEIPSFYYKFEEEGTRRRVMFSEKEIAGFKLWKKCYVSAYEATIQRSTNKLSSVVNTSPDYRGGVNDASRDNTFRSLLGRPASNFTLDEARTYARNRGSANWNCYLYSIHKMLCWLFVVEYATLNTHLDYTAKKIAGYMHGGLGEGVSGLGGLFSSRWSANPFVSCGVTNEAGNNTSVVNVQIKNSESTSSSFKIPTYRGIENPFGHLWKMVDGAFSSRRNSDGVMFTDLRLADNDDILMDKDRGQWRVISYVYPGVTGSLKEVFFGEYGDITAKSMGASNTTYFCNTSYSVGFGSLVVGGEASLSLASLGLFTLGFKLEFARASFHGTRLCYITQ